MQKMKITLVLILKNEAKTVRKTIESCASVIENVICGVDDKTIDNTIGVVTEACSDLGINLEMEEFTFQDDFASLRNDFISKVQTDWVLILDGHEYIQPSSTHFLRDLADNDIANEFEIFDFNVVDRDFNKGSEIYFQQPRLFKNHVRYAQAIHNVIYQEHKRTSIPQIVIVHAQPVDRLKARQQQRKKMNIDGLVADANEGLPRAMYYLGNTYYEMGDLKKAEKWYKKYIPISDFDAERYVAKINLANIFKDQGKDIEAKKVLLSCFEDEIALNEHLLMLGDLMMKQGKYHRAKDFYSMATNVQMPNRFLLINKDAYTWLPWYRLAVAGVATNDYELIRECIIKGKQFAPDRVEFFELEAKIKERYKDNDRKLNGTIYIVASLPHFIKPFMKYLLNNYHVIYESQFNPDTADKCDVIWCEWGDHNAIAVSHYRGSAKKILRIHAYEVFTDFPNKINFDGFDDIVFVADHIRQYFAGRTKTTAKSHLIPNGVDLNKFSIPKKKKQNKKIAYAGYITNKKGAVLLLSAAFELSRENYEFHVAGEFQEPDVKQFFEHQKPSNLYLYPWQQDLNSFFADKTYIINTSPREGCPVSILEGMAAGLKPLVFNWIGAPYVIGDDFTWMSMYSLKETIEHLNKFKFDGMRQIVAKNYNQEDQFRKMDNIISNLIKELHHGRQKQNKVA